MVYKPHTMVDPSISTQTKRSKGHLLWMDNLPSHRLIKSQNDSPACKYRPTLEFPSIVLVSHLILHHHPVRNPRMIIPLYKLQQTLKSFPPQSRALLSVHPRYGAWSAELPGQGHRGGGAAGLGVKVLLPRSMSVAMAPVCRCGRCFLP